MQEVMRHFRRTCLLSSLKSSHTVCFFELFFAVVDESGDFAAKVFAVDNHIYKAVCKHKFGCLKTLRQLYLYSLGNRTRPGKADKRAGLGYYAITHNSKTGRYPAGCRV